MMALVVAVLFSVQAQDPSCPDTVIAGRIESGAAFEAPFGDGLIFRLDPETNSKNPQGWTIRVTPADRPETDYLMVATPPYRFSNPRYLDTGYAVSAEAALRWSPRQFQYVTTRADHETAKEALGVLLWPAGYSETEITDAEAALAGVRAHRGSLWIEDGAIALSDDDNVGETIAWIQFRAELCRTAD